MLKSVDEVVEALGGTVAVASLAEVGKQAVSNWRARGVIPSEYFLRVSLALAVVGTCASHSVFGLKSAERPETSAKVRV
jgi:hypothetical protein